jgi:hypothetical protein
MDSSSAVDLDALSPPDSPIPGPRSQNNGRSLFFSQQEPVSVTDEELATLATGEDDAGASDSDAPWSEYADPSDDGHHTSTESPAGDRPAQLLSKRQMRQTAETAVKVGTGMAHTVAARSDAQKQVGLYLADDDDAVNIGHPLADIMHRRGDIVGGKLSPDANDFLRSLMGVAGYFTKQVQKIGVVRQLEAGAAAGEPQTFPGGAA